MPVLTLIISTGIQKNQGVQSGENTLHFILLDNAGKPCLITY